MEPSPTTTTSSPEGVNTFITALQNGPPGEPELMVPTQLFQSSLAAPANEPPRKDDEVDDPPIEDGDDGDEDDTNSNASAEDAKASEEAMDEAFWDRVNILIKKEDDTEAHVQIEDDGSGKDVFDMTRGSTSISYPKVPTDWTPTARKGNQPAFEAIDNPGDWPEYCLRPKFAKGDKKKNTPPSYAHHAMPTGARPVPVDNSTGKRVLNEWEFFYRGWHSRETYDLVYEPVRDGATSKNPFPDCRKGKLDYALLSKLGVTKDKILTCDALLFYQLLLPLGDPKKNNLGGTKDPRLGFYSDVELFTAKYASSLGMGGSYGNSFSPPKIEDLLHFDMITVRDGVLGGSKGAVHLRWDQDDSLYDETISSSMSYFRFKQIKRTYKLNDNDFDPTNKDPAKKFDFLYKVLVHNTNALTELAELDQCLDETTYGHAGYGPKGAGLMRRLIGKKVNKGGQTVLCSDVHRKRIRAYSHRHKLHKPFGTEWTREGPNEARRIAETLSSMVQSTTNQKGIFKKKPMITADNYFGSDLIDKWMGKEGFGFLHTVRRDCLPHGIPNWAWHKESISATDHRTKVARFLHPITAVHVTAGYTRVLSSFQSTGPTNISAVNALNTNYLFARTKSRGTERENQKRQWVIEMNDSRQLYLATYGQIDTIDQYIKQCNIFYVTWKYWHAAKNHAICLALTTAYDFYEELFDEPKARSYFGITGEDTRQAKKLSFHQFRDRLSKQGIAYDPGLRLYMGDERMRKNTNKTKERREGGQKLKTPQHKRARLIRGALKAGRPPKDDTRCGVVTPEMLKKAKTVLKKRFCGSLTKYIQHEESVRYLDNKVYKKGKVCYWCGDYTWSFCGCCQDPVTKEAIYLHHCPRTGKSKGKCCFAHFHNEDGFGLARMDSDFLGEKKCNWSKPTKKEIREHTAALRDMRIELETEEL